MSPRVTAVVVTYDAPGRAHALVENLLSQTRKELRVLVVDNGSRKPFSFRDARVECVRLPENTGSAGGYHEGVSRAMKDADFVLTLDDDVEPAPDCAEKLLEAYAALSGGRRLAAVRAVGETHFSAEPTELEIAPWRGTLFSAAALREVGPPEAGYFLYGEDLEYSLRLRRAGYAMFWAPAAVCPERRQGKTDDLLLGRKVAIYPSAWRLFYAFRNETAICLEYQLAGRLLRTALYALKVTVYLALKERTDAAGKLAAVWRGLAAGFLRERGKDPRYAPS